MSVAYFGAKPSSGKYVEGETNEKFSSKKIIERNITWIRAWMILIWSCEKGRRWSRKVMESGSQISVGILKMCIMNYENDKISNEEKSSLNKKKKS